MIGVAHQPPGFAVIVYMFAPGECFVADPETAPGCAFTGFMEIGQEAASVALGLRRATRADQQQIGLQFAHHVEFALKPIEGAGANCPGQSFKIAKWLEYRASQVELAHQIGDFTRAQVRAEQIVLEYLGACKPSRCDRPQLAVKRATDRYRRNRSFYFRNRGSPANFFAGMSSAFSERGLPPLGAWQK
jgi:hypothetical protein